LRGQKFTRKHDSTKKRGEAKKDRKMSPGMNAEKRSTGGRSLYAHKKTDSTNKEKKPAG